MILNVSLDTRILYDIRYSHIFNRDYCQPLRACLSQPAFTQSSEQALERAANKTRIIIYIIIMYYTLTLISFSSVVINEKYVSFKSTVLDV